MSLTSDAVLIAETYLSGEATSPCPTYGACSFNDGSCRPGHGCTATVDSLISDLTIERSFALRLAEAVRRLDAELEACHERCSTLRDRHAAEWKEAQCET